MKNSNAEAFAVEARALTECRTLTRTQIVRLVIFGSILWILAAGILRIIGPMGAFDGMALVILYALIIPGTVPFIFISRKIAGLASDQIAMGVATMTATATLLDGIALAWFSPLYGGDIKLIAYSSAVILWGAGVGLVLGFIFNRPVVIKR
jgi:hypothetical protein